MHRILSPLLSILLSILLCGGCVSSLREEGYHSAWYVSAPTYAGQAVGYAAGIPLALAATPPLLLTDVALNAMSGADRPGFLTTLGVLYIVGTSGTLGGKAMGCLPKALHLVTHPFRGPYRLEDTAHPDAYGGYCAAMFYGDFTGFTCDGLTIDSPMPAPPAQDGLLYTVPLPHGLYAAGWHGRGRDTIFLKRVILNDRETDRAFYLGGTPRIAFSAEHVLVLRYSAGRPCLSAAYGPQGRLLGYFRLPLGKQPAAHTPHSASGWATLVDEGHASLFWYLNGYDRATWCETPKFLGLRLQPNWALGLAIEYPPGFDHSYQPQTPTTFRLRNDAAGWRDDNVWDVLATTAAEAIILRRNNETGAFDLVCLNMATGKERFRQPLAPFIKWINHLPSGRGDICAIIDQDHVHVRYFVENDSRPTPRSTEPSRFIDHLRPRKYPTWKREVSLTLDRVTGALATSSANAGSAGTSQ